MTPSEWEKQFAEISNIYLVSIQKASDFNKLDELKVSCLGRKGSLSNLLRLLKDFPLEEKKTLGVKGNDLKNKLLSLIESKKSSLETGEINASLSKEKIDIMLPSYPFECGKPHPLTIASKKMFEIFTKLGFDIVEGPLIEDEKTNFDDLNTPAHHPARAMQDTFYLDTEKSYLLRTHTSNMQIRYMRKNKPPIRIISPGKVFRRDSVDASHSPVFHQIEGLYVDKNVSMADLRYTLTAFMQGIFGEGAEIRFRPSYFPFVEPGVEVDVKCVFCQKGKHCSVCKSTGWIEMLGAGMVHKNVFEAVGIDPEIYSGYAWGMGVERLAMLMYGIDDIRLFYENDVRILKQF